MIAAVAEISSAADLGLLLHGGTQYRGISLSVPGLPADETKSWEARLAHDYSGCGCDTGSWFVIGAFIAIGLFVWLTWASPEWSWRGRGGVAFATIVAASLIGKLTGLVLAKRRLRRTIATLAPMF